jgi:hypothetical protein
MQKGSGGKPEVVFNYLNENPCFQFDNFDFVF